MRTPFESSGFTPPPSRALGVERRRVALAELIAIAGLALSTIVAATVVSVGIARADVIGSLVRHDSGALGVALLLGLIFVGMGGLTAAAGRKPNKR